MRTTTRRRIIGVACAVFLGSLLGPTATAAFRYLQEGMMAPQVSGEDLRSGDQVTAEPQPGELILITFWATWSQRSLDLLADLKTIVEQYPDHPLRIIAVNVEDEKITSSVRERIEQVLAELELPYPVIIDEGLSIFYEFGVIAVPSTAILDSTGILRFAPSGYSYTVRDRIVDSIEILLGIREPSEETFLITGYQPTNKASRYYRLAVQMTGRGMYERALANLVPAIAADSNFSAPHNLRGQLLLELDSMTAAAEEFALAVKLDSNSVAAWAGWGRALLREEQFDVAFKKLARALALESYYTPALLDLSFCLAEQGQKQEALDSLIAARELNPRDPAVHYYLGQVYQDSGQKAEAVRSYLAGLEIVFPAP